MTDMNSQAKPGGSKSGAKAPLKPELSHNQFEHERKKRDKIEAHQHKDDLQETD